MPLEIQSHNAQNDIYCLFLTIFSATVWLVYSLTVPVLNPVHPGVHTLRWVPYGVDIVQRSSHKRHSLQCVSLVKMVNCVTIWPIADMHIWFSWHFVNLSVPGTASTFWQFSYTLAFSRTKGEEYRNCFMDRVTLGSILQVQMALTQPIKQETFSYQYSSTGFSFWSVIFILCQTKI